MSFLLMVCNSPFPLPHCSVKEKTIFLSDIYWLSNLPNSYCHERVHLEVWSSHSALEDFKASPEYSTYSGGLFAVSQPVRSREVDAGANTWWIDDLKPGLALVTVYFSAPVCQEQRERICKLRGLRPSWARREPGQQPLWGLPIQLWAVGTGERKGREMQAFLWLHFWKSAEREREYKEKEQRWEMRGNVAYRKIGVMEYLAQQLETVGAEEWVEEHVDFRPVPEWVECGFEDQRGSRKR